MFYKRVEIGKQDFGEKTAENNAHGEVEIKLIDKDAFGVLYFDVLGWGIGVRPTAFTNNSSKHNIPLKTFKLILSIVDDTHYFPQILCQKKLDYIPFFGKMR
jgi:hypothetical protein